MANVVRDCTDTSPEAKPGEKEPWLLRKSRYLESLDKKPGASLLMTEADKDHNGGNIVLDARRDSAMWDKFNAGLDGSAWYRCTWIRSSWIAYLTADQWSIWRYP